MIRARAVPNLKQHVSRTRFEATRQIDPTSPTYTSPTVLDTQGSAGKILPCESNLFLLQAVLSAPTLLLAPQPMVCPQTASKPTLTIVVKFPRKKGKAMAPFQISQPGPTLVRTRWLAPVSHRLPASIRTSPLLAKERQRRLVIAAQ